MLVHPSLRSGRRQSEVTLRWRERMRHTNTALARSAGLVLLAGIIGCGSDLVLPDTPASQENVALTKMQGDEQTGAVGEVLGTPLIVKVVTQTQQPASGVEVAFALSDPAGGTVTPPTATTNSDGEAVAMWTLGTVPGTYTATAQLVGAGGEDQVTQFQAIAIAGAPDTLAAQSPLAQPGLRNQPVSTPPQVRVVDRFGNAIPGVPVSWQVISGGGQVSSPITATDERGLASVEWDLGNQRGVHKLTAAIDKATGSPVTFTATVLF
jgi:hypothetical protein